MPDQKELSGFCFFWSETGTEGGYWAFQDKNFIYPPNADWPEERWSYDGLHVLKDGDQLTIYSKECPEQVVWMGAIKLKRHPVFTRNACGLWIHADQEGVDREIWAHWFIKGHPAKLTKLPAASRGVFGEGE